MMPLDPPDDGSPYEPDESICPHCKQLVPTWELVAIPDNGMMCKRCEDELIADAHATEADLRGENDD